MKQIFKLSVVIWFVVFISHGAQVSGRDAGDTHPSIVIWKADGAVMIKMHGKIYQIGGTKQTAETPRHSVHLEEYYIDRTEVTWRMYLKFCEATKRAVPNKYRNTKPFPRSQLEHPVIDVTWDDAVTYCQWAGKRLPTENEWECACAGRHGRPYPWGNSINYTSCNISNNTLGWTVPVGSRQTCKTPEGVMDMTGNVYEWTTDWYKSYRGAQMKWDYTGRMRVAKGGSYVHSIDLLRCQARYSLVPDEYSSYGGFRCVVTPGKDFSEKTTVK
jgi:formylglycine-generating enzyme required for sulfatase activity